MNEISALLVIYWRFDKKETWNAWPLKMGNINCPETLVINYKSTLCNIPQERRLLSDVHHKTNVEWPCVSAVKPDDRPPEVWGGPCKTIGDISDI
jgi:hypothetical protein